MNSKVIDDTFLQRFADVYAETETGLSWSRIARFFRMKAVSFGVDLKYPHDKYPPGKLPNKRTGFFENLKSFNAEQQYLICKELGKDEFFAENEPALELYEFLIDRYSELDKTAENDLIKKAQQALKNREKPNVLINAGVNKISKKEYRNGLDDLRLGLEIQLREILGNKKSLENQNPDLGEFLKNKGGSVEISNMFVKVLDYYSKYQNENVKHDDRIKEEEVVLIKNLTSSIIIHLESLCED